MARGKTSAGNRGSRKRSEPTAWLGLVLLVGGVQLLVQTLPAFAAESRGIAFETHEIELGPVERPTILTADLLDGDSAEIAVVHRDEMSDTKLGIYVLEEDGWRARTNATLRSEIAFVDVVAIAGRDRLITIGGDRLTWFDPESMSEHTIVDVLTRFNSDAGALPYAGAELMGPSHDSEVAHVDISRDLNWDGRDDLVIPDRDGFWISTQLGDGTFTDPTKLGPSEPFVDEMGLDEKRRYGDVGLTAVTIPWYLSRVHQFDENLDGLTDLAFWDGDRFLVYRQGSDGRFSPTAEAFTTEVEFGADGTYSLLFGFSDQSTFALLTGFRRKSEQTVLHSLADMNRDDVTDLVTMTLSGRSLLRQRSRYEVHFGSATPEGLVFAREAGLVIRPRGKAAGLQHSGYSLQWAQDLDGDGRVEMIRRDVRIGVSGMIRTLVGKSVALDIEVHRIADDRGTEAAMTRRRVRPALRPFTGWGDIFFPPLLLGDVDGDGRDDLVVGENRDELHVFLGVPGPELFARAPQEVPISLPVDERSSWLADLDRDGRQDLLLHQQPTSRVPDLPHRLTVLLSR